MNTLEDLKKALKAYEAQAFQLNYTIADDPELSGEEYHAWISTYIKDKGWINGIIEFDGTSWNMLDPTFASTSDSPKKFIAQKNDYITKYVY